MTVKIGLLTYLPNTQWSVFLYMPVLSTVQNNTIFPKNDKSYKILLKFRKVFLVFLKFCFNSTLQIL